MRGRQSIIPLVILCTSLLLVPDAKAQPGADAICIAGDFVPKASPIVALSTDSEGTAANTIDGLINAGAASVTRYSRSEIEAGTPIVDGANVLVIQLVATLESVSPDYIDGVRALIESGASVVASYDGAALMFDEFGLDIVTPPLPNFDPPIALFSGAVHGGGILLPIAASAIHFVDQGHPLASGVGATFSDGNARFAFSIDNFDTEWLHTVATFDSQGFGGLNPVGTYPAILAGRCGEGRVALYTQLLFAHNSPAVQGMLTNALDWVTGKGEALNNPPTSAAGADQAVRVGDEVFLDGGASFDDNTESASLMYQWSLTEAPVASNASLTGADTPTPSFNADLLGTYIIELVVTDEGSLPSLPDSVEISTDNLAPTANAGVDIVIITATPVALDGSRSSDPDGDGLLYSWSISSAPDGSTASPAPPTSITPLLIPNVEGQYVVELLVSDFIGPSEPDTVVITATDVSTFPELQIEAGNTQIVSLQPESVTTGGNQQALTNYLAQATVALQSENTTQAANRLEQAIARTDGCALRGSPDGNGPGRDWITDCDSQEGIYAALTSVLAAITP
jgi:hypothetical protein